MIKIVNLKKYKELVNKNNISILLLYGIASDYSKMTYQELSQIRRKRIKELKSIDKKIEDMCKSLGEVKDN
tara:strand:+ start:162 stop:374 length:213 start_codon:yes stop_codon:yes gene_type:complete